MQRVLTVKPLSAVPLAGALPVGAAACGSSSPGGSQAATSSQNTSPVKTHGRTVKIVKQDDQCSPTQAVQVVRQITAGSGYAATVGARSALVT